MFPSQISSVAKALVARNKRDRLGVLSSQQGVSSMRTPIGDQVLVSRLQAGDVEAMQDLAAAYGSKIYQLAFRYLRNREDAEEIKQDVLLKVWQKISAFRGDAALPSWIYCITVNSAMSRLRGRATQSTTMNRWSDLKADPRFADSTRAVEVVDRALPPDARLSRSELRRKLQSAIRELPAIYRAAVVLRDLRGLSTQEASTVLRVKDQTLKSRLHRGRSILRATLAEFADGLSWRNPVPAM